ncbi:carboxylating nicotinate-nucleotide diphosphorylase [Roseospira marina]|uniref:Probable nicotinate-nucleotide pyrophosphorylase [carboxylating] n=1 Tax=Roseospira marina TaxID=140057 RepID=A0A5M6I4B4_9PROT|nr:carboxylating nicotinate-nucleotide diphosphorylase [Roseospira marina]KAA5603012.1 carboxylating nicotinate-nucleotide diphosphorylase [Roseospira marina]MBB4316211.1 nicotinate-nucleotide pyrophosphorylase (carboxylating) [Roseospira marina]MBB5087807.1 nicotinate-nucleotide pyrophosphorylase (carboxylating) [Roseospira marina]
MVTPSERGPLPDLLIEPVVRAALLEDLGRGGDITTDSLVPPDRTARAEVVARREGVVAGARVAALAFRLLDARVIATPRFTDGQPVRAGDAILTLDGPARALLSAERVALNFLGHLSGIATETARMVAAVQGTRARIACTRKTTPGLRALEKYAVRVAGGINHRLGLDDAVLIKDNHIAVMGGITAAIAAARAHTGHMTRIQVEVDSLDQLDEALAAAPDAILFDNMSPETLAEGVRRVAGRAITEASGGITPDHVAAVAASGVDVISVGWLTHSAPSLDVSLDMRAPT